MDVKTTSRIAVVISCASLFLSAAALYESTNDSPQFMRTVDSVEADSQRSDVSYIGERSEEVEGQNAAGSRASASAQASLVSDTNAQSPRGNKELFREEREAAPTLTTSQARRVSYRNGEMVINIGEFREVDAISSGPDADAMVINLGPHLDPDDLANHPKSVESSLNVGAEKDARLD